MIKGGGWRRGEEERYKGNPTYLQRCKAHLVYIPIRLIDIMTACTFRNMCWIFKYLSQQGDPLRLALRMVRAQLYDIFVTGDANDIDWANF